MHLQNSKVSSGENTTYYTELCFHCYSFTRWAVLFKWKIWQILFIFCLRAFSKIFLRNDKLAKNVLHVSLILLVYASFYFMLSCWTLATNLVCCSNRNSSADICSKFGNHRMPQTKASKPYPSKPLTTKPLNPYKILKRESVIASKSYLECSFTETVIVLYSLVNRGHCRNSVSLLSIYVLEASVHAWAISVVCCCLKVGVPEKVSQKPVKKITVI